MSRKLSSSVNLKHLLTYLAIMQNNVCGQTEEEEIIIQGQIREDKKTLDEKEFLKIQFWFDEHEVSDTLPSR